jgi:hypothetical protein
MKETMFPGWQPVLNRQLHSKRLKNSEEFFIFHIFVVFKSVIFALSTVSKHALFLFSVASKFCHMLSKLSVLMGECIVHIDFSENFTCKMSSEIQSMHFGASKHQLSLHTAVYYIGNNSNQTTFCTGIVTDSALSL